MNNKNTNLLFTIAQFLKFKVERFLIRGPFFQVIFIALLIGLISIISGRILSIIDPSETDLIKNSWWAFLRLSDPGYLGDDNGLGRRILATFVTLLGYVLFMGSLVAIMTQWLYRIMKKLESGFTPITIKGHISILGYTNRTPIIVKQVLNSKGRLLRFLKRNRGADPTIVILNKEVSHELTEDLTTQLSSISKMKKVIFRTGDPMKSDDLARISVENSSAVIIPSTIYGGSTGESSDTRAIKSLMSIKNRAEQKSINLPKVVVEILDPNKADIAKAAYDHNLEIVLSRSIIARMMAQNIQNPGLSFVISELLTQDHGSQIYLKSFPQLDGKTWGDIRYCFGASLAIGFISSHSGKCLIKPQMNDILAKDDTIVFIATSFESIEYKAISSVVNNSKSFELDLGSKDKRKLLILGWSEKVPYLCYELLVSNKTDYSIVVLSSFNKDVRKRSLDNYLDKGMLGKIVNIEADFTSSKDMANINISEFSNIVFLASDRANHGEDADARSIFGILQLRNLFKNKIHAPVLVELAQSENEKLFSNRPGETIISPIIVSYILSNVALRPDLNIVFDSLFNAGGADFRFVESAKLGLSGDIRFSDISKICDEHSMIAIGVAGSDASSIDLNPTAQTVFKCVENLKIIVIF
ncbi:hypothetical protein [Halobacteriovorax sp. HLS]|uniref:CASTOR/POLLUX-related putative ion channel n=1 Tax=Halobacteriovorax sp. HLS TaxID=2234000 RepID=UPI000FD74DCB|nr:hypothetical protein [Halobacteriovorax sp. HLS]